MAGYALAKLQFAGHRPLMALVLATLMVPGSVTLVPLFVLMSKLGLVNSYAAVTVPFLAGAFGVFLMRQFMHSVPDDLIDAARIDGAGEWRIFWRIVLPLLKPALAALAVFQFLATWNNFLWPLVALTDQTQVHAAGRAGDVLDRPEQGRLRPADGRLGRARGAGDRALPRAPAPLHAVDRDDGTQGMSARAHWEANIARDGGRARRRRESCPRPRR